MKCPDCGWELVDRKKRQNKRKVKPTRLYCENPNCDVIFVEVCYPWGWKNPPSVIRVVRQAKPIIFTTPLNAPPSVNP